MLIAILLLVFGGVWSDIPGRPNTKNDEIIVSYFGVLVNNRTIVFNQKGIDLKAVVIDKDYISLTYGTPIWTRSIRLLCPFMGPDAMDEISEKFDMKLVSFPHSYQRELMANGLSSVLLIDWRQEHLKRTSGNSGKCYCSCFLVHVWQFIEGDKGADRL